MKNIELFEFMQQARKELRYTVAHRRGIILGYLKCNLDSLKKDELICDGERKIACYELDLYYDKIGAK